MVGFLLSVQIMQILLNVQLINCLIKKFVCYIHTTLHFLLTTNFRIACSIDIYAYQIINNDGLWLLSKEKSAYKCLVFPYTATNKISKLANNWKTVGTTVWFKKSIDNNMRYKCTEQLITLYNIKMKE